MHRFFIESSTIAEAMPGARVLLPERLAHQIRVVLHIAIDEQLVLLDNSGDELLCVVRKSSKVGVEVEIVERRPGKREPSVHVTLCQGMLKSARFEWILEKGTELGVSTFMPVHCRRSLAGLEEAGTAKQQRWQRIIQEATEQCGRARYPELVPIRPLTQALAEIPAGALAIMPWEEEREQSLRQLLRSVTSQEGKTAGGNINIFLFLGPEGGLTPDEAEQARQRGVHTVTLGQRILRAETAALATVANVLYELESYMD